MKIRFMPKSLLGKFSVVLIICMPIFFCMGMSFVGFYDVSAGRTILQDIASRPGVALFMLTGFISGIAAFFTGIFGMIKRKEHSVLLFLSTTIGFLVLLWCLAEFLFPH